MGGLLSGIMRGTTAPLVMLVLFAGPEVEGSECWVEAGDASKVTAVTAGGVVSVLVSVVVIFSVEGSAGSVVSAESFAITEAVDVSDQERVEL